MANEIPQDIKAFLANMLYMADEFDYGEEIPEGLMQELYKKLDDRITIYLLSRLPEEKLAEYRALNEKAGSPEMLDVYLSKNVPGYKEVMKEAYQAFYDSYLEQAQDNKYN